MNKYQRLQKKINEQEKRIERLEQFVQAYQNAIRNMQATKMSKNEEYVNKVIKKIEEDLSRNIQNSSNGDYS